MEINLKKVVLSVGIIILMLFNTVACSSVNYLKEYISSSLPQGIDIVDDVGETDVNLVKSDIEGIYDDLKVDVSKQEGVLFIKVVENKESPLPASEFTISAYTDWCLDNIKDDIKSIDFTVNTSNGKVRAILDTSKIETSNGRYFSSNYIANNIQK